MKPPVPTKRATVSSINIKSYNELLRLLLVCTGGHPKSVLRQKFVILDTYHPDTLYLRHQGCEDPWLPHILECNLHPFYSFRGLKYEMRIRIACGLDSPSRAEFGKNDRDAVRAVRTIQ